MILPKRPEIAVIDASVLVALCSHEPVRYPAAKTVVDQYEADDVIFYAPRVIISETLFVLCRQLKDGTITPPGHAQAIRSLPSWMANILPPPYGDVSLIARAEQIRASYSCYRSADSLYLALAEELTLLGSVEVLTFDTAMPNQAASNAHGVHVRLL